MSSLAENAAQASAAPPSVFDAAQEYVRLGLHPIPVYGLQKDAAGHLICRGKQEKCLAGTCAAGKHPIGNAWQQGPLDTQSIANLYADVCGGHNVGLRMGLQPSGKCLIGIDVDNMAAFEPLEKRLGQLPDTIFTMTGSGRGMHYIVEVTPDVLARLANVGNKSDGFGYDLRVEGGQCVAGPSLHITGNRYQTDTGFPIAALPQPWVDYLLSREGAPKVRAVMGDAICEASETLRGRMYLAAVEDTDCGLDANEDGPDKMHIVCPGIHESGSNEADSSTTIMATEDGKGAGNCKHATCSLNADPRGYTAALQAWLVRHSPAARGVLEAHDKATSDAWEQALGHRSA